MILGFLASCLVFSACGKNNNKNLAFNNSSEAFGFASATAGKLLETLQSKDDSLLSLNAPSQSQNQTAETLNKYVDIFESVVGNNALQTKKEHLDDFEYNFQITTQITDLNGQKQVFIMKIKEVKADNSPILETDSDEIETHLTGILYLNSQEYPITGKKSIENDEIEIEFLAKIDDENYIKIAQEFENNEQEFEYQIFKNGTLYDSFSIEVEKDKNDIEVEIECQTNLDIMKYRFEREGNRLKITYKENSAKQVVYAKISNDHSQVTYEFSGGIIITKNR